MAAASVAIMVANAGDLPPALFFAVVFVAAGAIGIVAAIIAITSR